MGFVLSRNYVILRGNYPFSVREDRNMRRIPWRALILLLLTLPFLLGAGGVGDELGDGTNSVRVYYVQQSGALQTRDPVLQALTLSDQVVLVTDPNQADAIVAYNARPSPQEINAVRERGIGMVLFIGPQLDTQLVALGELGLGWGGTWGSDPVSVEHVPGVSDPVLEQIAWSSAPQVKGRSSVVGVNDNLQALVQTEADHALILGRTTAGKGTVFVFTPWVTRDRAHNRDLIEWPYWNYLVYHLTVQAAGGAPLSYADYPGSPVPHAPQQVALVVVLAMMLGGTVGAFVWVRGYSRRHPERLDRIVANVQRYNKLQQSAWDEVGFHRPLAGLLFLVAVGLVLFIVIMIYQQYILFGQLLDSAQARGWWSLITTFFTTFWILFDWGTATAFVKFFAEYRVDNPREGIKYAQLYVWWQAITGTLQLGLVVIIAALVVPHTGYAFMSYFLILHALIQFPGFLTIFQSTFRAFQKQDYDQLLNLFLYLAPILVQSVAVYALTRWGLNNPVFGESMGGVFGLGLGAYVTQVVVFVVGYLLLKRLGYNASVLFMAHFDRDTLMNALRFGAPITVAGIAGGLGYTVQTLLVATYVLNWPEVQGNWDVVSPQGLLLAYSAVAGLYYGLMPAISEAFNHGRLALTRYYIAQGFKYGGFFSAFIASALIGVGDRFILGALGEDYRRAAGWIVVMGVWGMIQFPAWFADRLQEGTGRPDLEMWLLIFEQALRIGLMFLLMRSLGVTGLILAYVVALPLKNIAAWWVNDRVIMRYRIYWWQTAVAPLLAGAVNWFLLRALGAAMGGDAINQIASVVLFFIALLPALPVFCFLDGLFGGWDNAGLSELRRAAGMSSLGKPIAWLIYYSSTFGARLSPLHGRFPIDAYDSAKVEATDLTEGRVSLVG
jgi:O-antigen/teichoic acid export membrane protein